ncbi:unnamed protein product [Calypogeia fissa]
MRTFGKVGKAVRGGSTGKLAGAAAKDRVWLVSSLLFSSSILFFLFVSWQDPRFVAAVQHLFEGRNFALLRYDEMIRAHSGDSRRGCYNLLVDPSSNYTSTLAHALHQNATSTSPCYMDTTNSTVLEGLPEPDDGKYILFTDKVHHLTLIAYGLDGESRCAGGDYFEVDLHDTENLHYRSRPTTVDYGNGSYGIEIMVPSRFAGTFSLEIWLLFSNWHGMDFQPGEFKKGSLMVAQEVEMVVESEMEHFMRWSLLGSTPGLRAKHYAHELESMKQCTVDDFERATWQGRWSRNWSRPGCQADEEKRFKCLDEEHYQCEEPWCFGPVGRLESNGWAYSAHCGFKIYEAEEAWKCLDGKWFLMWGDSNFQDTIRNLLIFVLDWDLPPGENLADFQLARSYESAFINSKRVDQLFRVSQIFNGAYPDYDDGMGLDTLKVEEHQEKVLSHFRGERLPDAIFMNSGLHDGKHYATVEGYIESVDFAIDWWIKLYQSLPADRRPTLVWRTTIAPAGTSRGMQSNPNKMEMYNQVMVEKLRQVKDKLPVKFIDGFDMTFPFHYNNDFSDGGHYGRAPGVNLPPWYGSPHWYFVDVMLAHIFLNAVCPPTL